MDNYDAFVQKIIELSAEYAPRIVLALITFLIGLIIIKMIMAIINSSMERKNVDPTLRPFIANLASWGLRVLLFLSVASMVGVATASFVTVLGAAGLAVGLALQGSLANFAGGVLVIIFKPYKVGDLIEAQGYKGVVKELQIFNTILLTPDNKRVVIPNAAISNNPIVNFSAEGKLRVDMVIGISYESDIQKAKEILMSILKSDERVLPEPEPLVAVVALADSSVNLNVRPWVKFEDYWKVHYAVTEKAKFELERNGITIPFPQRDVHLYQHKDD